jgi:transketolase
MKSLEVKAADNIRILAAAMVEKARSGHPGGAMGGADFIHILYSEFLRYDPEDMGWKNRDRFFLDPGHMSPMLYSVLALAGYYSMEDLQGFRQWGSNTPGHPEVDVMRGIENTSGPLGQGHAMAVGAAIAERFLAARFGEVMAHKTYAFISDGGVQEEVSQGAGRLAGYLGLSNLIMFYDSNDIQLSTTTAEVTAEDTARKYEAWGWNVTTIDGNDAGQIREALKSAQDEKEKPTLIIGKTIMGKGALKEDGTSYERKTATHGMPLSEAGASFEKSILHLGGDPAQPFKIFSEVEACYSARRQELKALATERKAAEARWAAENPGLAQQLEEFFSGKAPAFDYAAIVQKDHQATRAASSTMLAAFAGKIGNLIVASADLSNSDKTDGFLKKTKAFRKGDFSGSFLQAGVAELTMACVMNGMALHGGVIVAGGTFFVFSDYMKPAVRLAALMELPVKYIWTHDAFRVGEDGPTHQPVEQEAQIRLMEKLQNHKGHNSMLVLRPADVHETTVAWQLAMENNATPTALILSRQNITNLPVKGDPYTSALQAARGAYIVEDDGSTPDVVLLASGSEVATLVEGAALLRQRNHLSVRVVSVPSEGRFRSQPADYQQEILPAGIPRFGMTAGLSVTLAGLVGEKGAIWGMNSFGYSAPYKILDTKLGFNGENVCKQVLKLLGL